MYSGYGGSPSRTLSTMSLSVRPIRRLTSRSITRSQSLTGVNTYDKTYRNLSVFSTPGLSRKPSRASRIFTMSTKCNPPPKVPQPERLDQVYEALKKGLQSYLQVHQIDLESLSHQMKESRRNSRLGFLYEVDKQVKVTERYIRRLEFHLSKIEELYEAYCLQRRLRDGADKMVKAYTHSPGSKEARESLAEVNKGQKEYTENMCVLESEFENHLGEFHIKMKGLAGFARLCAGDQYEIMMRYGRQRWRLRGKMEMNAKQAWDSDEMLFLPLINEFLSVKVTELKSLANHVVVGSVSCETKDLFTARPQTVAVDINDLGTVKLSLEVTWNPFDKEEQGSISSTVNKAPPVSKRLSTIFNQSPPGTPSLREQAFYSLPRNLNWRQHWPLLDIFKGTLSQSCSCSDNSSTRQPSNMLRRREELENGTAWSNSSESSDDSSHPQLSVQGLHTSAQSKPVVKTKDNQPAMMEGSSPKLGVPSSPPDSKSKLDPGSEAPSIPKLQLQNSRKDETTLLSELPLALDNNASCCYARSLSHISESSADGMVMNDRSTGESVEAMSPVSGISINNIRMELPSRGAVSEPELAVRKEDATVVDPNIQSPMARQPDSNMRSHSSDRTYVARHVPVVDDVASGGGDQVSLAGDSVMDSGLEDILGIVVSSLDDYRGQFPELQLLEQELKMLQVTLKGGRHSRSPSVVSLTVETALGSFDFLNTSDWEEEEEEENRSDRRRRGGRSLQDRGWDVPSSPTSPLTTGCSNLDFALVVHLTNCSTQLLHLGTFGPLRCGEMYALDKLLREAQVLEIIRCLIKNDPRRPRQPTEVLPQLAVCEGAVSLWQHCVGQDSVYSVSADRFLNSLSIVYSKELPESPVAVFMCLLERVLDQRLPQRCSRDTVTVTVFQLWIYLESNSINDLETHISELTQEVWFVKSLASCDQEVVLHTLRRPVECSLKRDGLPAVVRLLKDPRARVSASASSVLRGLAAQPGNREQALVRCLELLEDDDVDTRVCGCKALACLKAKESIDQLVYLCRTDNEEIRDAAKQTLLLLGEEGKMAHRHVETSKDTLPRLFTPGSMASTAF